MQVCDSKRTTATVIKVCLGFLGPTPSCKTTFACAVSVSRSGAVGFISLETHRGTRRWWGLAASTLGCSRPQTRPSRPARATAPAPAVSAGRPGTRFLALPPGFSLLVRLPGGRSRLNSQAQQDFGRGTEAAGRCQVGASLIWTDRPSLQPLLCFQSPNRLGERFSNPTSRWKNTLLSRWVMVSGPGHVGFHDHATCVHTLWNPPTLRTDRRAPCQALRRAGAPRPPGTPKEQFHRRREAPRSSRSGFSPKPPDPGPLI